MKLNNKIKYALACLYELDGNSQEYLNADVIAERYKLPKAYAHKILQRMAQVGLVLAQKGAGYKLARPLSFVSAFDVINTLSVDGEENGFNPDVVAVLEKRIRHALEDIKLGAPVG